MHIRKRLAMGLLGLCCLAAGCSDGDRYDYNENNQPEYEYLTTIPAEQFAHQAMGFGWRRTDTRIINEDGYANDYRYLKTGSQFPSHYYFSKDSVTQFTSNGTDRIRRRFTYTYDERTNMLYSDAWSYMQLSKLSSSEMRMVEIFYEDDLHAFYAEATYERILPFDMYDFWNNYQEIQP